MTIIALVGDCTTTTALALASGWPSRVDAVVLEADRRGGSLAAWLDTPRSPSLSTIVANTAALGDSASTAWFAVDGMIRQAASGTRFIAAPVRAREANRAISEAGISLFPLIAGLSEPTILADLGVHNVVDEPPVLLSLAASIVVCHRQEITSSGASAVRLERLGELVELLGTFGVPLKVVLIGDRPFGLDEVERFLAAQGHVDLAMHLLPVDELTAAVLAGRTGVSERRLARLPLIRHAATLARRMAPSIAPTRRGRVDQLGDAP